MKRKDTIYGLTPHDHNLLQQQHGIVSQTIGKNLIKKIIRPRPASGHKGSFGHALLIVGNEGTLGAAVLSSMAALRSGCGLLTVLLPEGGVLPLLSNLPEAMTKVRTNVQDLRDLNLTMYDAIGFGPGVGVNQESFEMLLYLLQNYKGPLVIDADGLTILSQQREAQLDFYKRYHTNLIVKGANTSVVTGSGLFFNTNGNNGMATAGSGDVLTGIITSLCAQGYEPADAAVLGTYVHGMAGDEAAAVNSMHGLIASDIVNSIKFFFKEFETTI